MNYFWSVVIAASVAGCGGQQRAASQILSSCEDNVSATLVLNTFYTQWTFQCNDVRASSVETP